MSEVPLEARTFHNQNGTAPCSKQHEIGVEIALLAALGWRVEASSSSSSLSLQVLEGP